MPAFRSQQFRWAKGSVEVARKLDRGAMNLRVNLDGGGGADKTGVLDATRVHALNEKLAQFERKLLIVEARQQFVAHADEGARILGIDAAFDGVAVEPDLVLAA